MARVVVCDGHSAIQMALASKIEESDGLEVVGTAGSVEELFAVLDTQDADALVLELTLPSGIGVDLIRELRQRYPNVQVVIYTMYDETIYAARAIRAGACGYVMKRESTEDVVQAINAALRRDVYVSEQVAAQLSAENDADAGILHPTNILTNQEMAVFQLLGEGRPPEEIAERLNFPRNEIDELQQQALDKLGLETREALVQYASRIVHQ